MAIKDTQKAKLDSLVADYKITVDFDKITTAPKADAKIIEILDAIISGKVRTRAQAAVDAKGLTEVYGNAWKLLETGDYTALCILTNGSVNKYGEAVMGRGIAYEATWKIQGIQAILGAKIKESGHIVRPICKYKDKMLVSFPTKITWNTDADLDLIKRSCVQLMEKLTPTSKVLLPRPGCGNGKLDWAIVKEAIKPLLDSRVTIVAYEKDQPVVIG